MTQETTSVSESRGVFTVDSALVVTSWDPWLEEMTGLKASVVRGRPLLEVYPEIGKAKVDALSAVLAKGEVRVLSPRLHGYLLPIPPPGEGSPYPWMQQRVTMAPLREGDGIVGAVISVDDVTARLVREDHLVTRLDGADEAARLELMSEVREVEDPSVIAPFVEALGDDSWRVRRAAVDGLARRGSQEAVEMLLRALREEHQDLSVLNSALQVLAMLGFEVVESLAALLRDPDKDLRIYAALALGEAGDHRAVEYLLPALDDPDPNVGYHAVEALGRLKAAEAVEPLVRLARSSDFHLAFPAVQALGAIGDPSVLEGLEPMIEDALLRDEVLEVYGELGTWEVVPVLLPHIEEQGGAPSVAKALVRLRDRYEGTYGEGDHVADLTRELISPLATRRLIESLDAVDEGGRAPVVQVLGWLDGPEVERALCGLLGLTSVQQRDVIAALMRLGRRAVRVVVEQSRVDDAEIRGAAVQALGRIGGPEAVDRLLEMLSEDPELAAAAADALAKIGDRHAFDGLFVLIGHEDPNVREAVIGALNSLGHPEMAGRVAQALLSEDSTERESAVRIAGYFGYPGLVAGLLELANDPVDSVRAAVIEHLPYLEDDGSWPIVAAAMSDRSARVRGAAIRAADSMRGADSVRMVSKALDDPDMWVRYLACRALSSTSDGFVADALIRVAREDPFPPVRAAAVDALSGSADPRAFPLMMEMTESTDSDVAAAALEGLGRTGRTEALGVLRRAAASGDTRLVRAAVTGLGHLGVPEAVASILWVASGSPDREIFSLAAATLARIGSQEAISGLLSMTVDPERRATAVGTLAGLGERGIGGVTRGLDHVHPRVRSASVEVLLRIKHPSATASAMRGLEDEDADVRLATLLRLDAVDHAPDVDLLSRLARSDPDPRVRAHAHRFIRGR